MIFDKTTLEFLKRNEDHINHRCSADGSKMTFDSKHGYYVCKKNKLHHKAPQILIANGNKPVKLYWSDCTDCNFTNVSTEQQEAVFYLGRDSKTQKQIFKDNKSQEKIECTNCSTIFKKPHPGKIKKEVK